MVFWDASKKSEKHNMNSKPGMTKKIKKQMSSALNGLNLKTTLMKRIPKTIDAS